MKVSYGRELLTMERLLNEDRERVRELEGVLRTIANADDETVEEIREYAAGYCPESVDEESDPMERLRDEHAAEMARLREAAKKLDAYTQHSEFCDFLYLYKPNARCDCGLEEARKLLLAQ